MLGRYKRGASSEDNNLLNSFFGVTVKNFMNENETLSFRYTCFKNGSFHRKRGWFFLIIGRVIGFHFKINSAPYHSFKKPYMWIFSCCFLAVFQFNCMTTLTMNHARSSLGNRTTSDLLQSIQLSIDLISKYAICGTLFSSQLYNLRLELVTEET